MMIRMLVAIMGLVALSSCGCSNPNIKVHFHVLNNAATCASDTDNKDSLTYTIVVTDENGEIVNTDFVEVAGHGGTSTLDVHAYDGDKDGQADKFEVLMDGHCNGAQDPLSNSTVGVARIAVKEGDTVNFTVNADKTFDYQVVHKGAKPAAKPLINTLTEYLAKLAASR